MFDGIDPRSPTPLYEQIGVCIRVAVAAGELQAGEALPSVRQLSGALRVNPATVSQAYRELAREGFVEMRHGAGTYVREVPAARREEEQWLQAREVARRALAEAARLGIRADQLLTVLEREMEEVGGSTPEAPPPAATGVPGPSPTTEVEIETETLSEVGE